MLRIFLFFLSFITVFMLLGCVSEGGSEKKSSEGPSQTPPQLTILVGEKILNPVRGTYSWSYDNGDGTSTGINADSSPPPILTENQRRVKVTPKTDIELNFGKAPTDYQVKEWDSNNNVKDVYDEVVLPQSNGKVVYEVLANWDQGTVSYAFSLNVKK